MTTKRSCLMSLCLTIALCASLPAQQGDLALSADNAYQQKDWQAAEKLYSQLSHSDAGVPRYWYRLGVAAQALGDHQKALDAFEHAKAKGSPPS